MSTLYGNLWSALAGYIQSWMLPSTFGVGFFAVALLPHVEDQSPWSGLADARSADGALLFASATLVVSFALAVSARPFVRFLEGYTLRPRWLRDRWTASQQASRKSLRQKISPTSWPGPKRSSTSSSRSWRSPAPLPS